MPGSDATDLHHSPTSHAGTLQDPDLLVLHDEAPAAGGGFDWFSILFMVVAMGAVMYFLVLRPQQKERAARDALFSSLSKGDEVITNGGLHGKITSVEDTTVKIEIGAKTVVTVEKDAIQRKAGDPPPASQKK